MSVSLEQSIRLDGRFYQTLQKEKQYNYKISQCIENTVHQLLKERTSSNRPGMLLGKVQSGKTRTFLGIMGLGYDNGYDLVIILTKGTNALARQTYVRVQQEFASQMEEDQMRVFDIMGLPDNLRKWERQQKLAFIVKKETKNMDRLKEALFEKYPDLSSKRILFIDDEADFASVAYQKNTEANIHELRVISGKIDELRETLPSSSFLQVTATPYSLYLQPEERKVHENKVFQPVRPAFTEIVPVHNQYVGGDMYFEKANNLDHMASHLFHEIEDRELEVMKKLDRRRVKLDQLLYQKNISNIREALVNFIVGSSIRRWQQRKSGARMEKYSCMIHTERGKMAHAWQEEMVNRMESQLRESAENDDPIFRELIEASYNDLMRSVSKVDLPQPSFQELFYEVRKAVLEEHLVSSVVNSEKDVNELLDHTGQLQLRAPMNIFIGGQILDRGITIGNLIGFFYGRNPKSFQQDTVLQHSRMYGARPLADVAVTRFYTTRHIYDVMERIHEFDTALRDAFESGGHDQGVVFIQKDPLEEMIPCSPNKILLSNIRLMKPHKRLLPIGFQTGYKTYIQKTVNHITKQLEKWRESPVKKKGEAFLIPVELASELLTLIHQTLEMEEGYEWDVEDHQSMLHYLSHAHDSENKGYVWIIVRENRQIQRYDKNGRFESSPDTPSNGKGELGLARKVATDVPALILLHQQGKKEHGWRGAPFWWPILVAPKETTPAVYASKTIS
ncbi:MULTISPECIES: Z1 domain-containing protein [Pontibacillus]|uniref:Z1 domain-containing protein n=1 Tax=Pontibacillus chungwhensis TaxID=265426 RepID=A0ABY8UXI6_9BACI|nr:MULTISPECIES: Z1 domain-containing protein [Pontibacillus]MCD5325684.1 Z1 domain-containing protein [Pontibacillus sp. HN14]WIF98075.1 Z1 domain-containing protein [Pontibacillus chungwhensis]